MNAKCYFCQKTCAVGVNFGGLSYCGNNQCIKLWYWREQWRGYHAGRKPRKRVEVKNKWAGGINGSQDETERIFSRAYQFQPKYRDMMIQKHREAVNRNMIQLGSQRKLKPDEVKAVNEQNNEADKQLEYAKEKEKSIANEGKGS